MIISVFKELRILLGGLLIVLGGCQNGNSVGELVLHPAMPDPIASATPLVSPGSSSFLDAPLKGSILRLQLKGSWIQTELGNKFVSQSSELFFKVPAKFLMPDRISIYEGQSGNQCALLELDAPQGDLRCPFEPRGDHFGFAYCMERDLYIQCVAHPSSERCGQASSHIRLSAGDVIETSRIRVSLPRPDQHLRTLRGEILFTATE